ncbi:MAG: nicotinate-nucleotide--dimethylbenzimidazole phosphoribosyltransferase [Ruminiclostridium sp.]|nr:nicotinate-nucleotide--dimethylbenzimidazole phosphoribosyltransferase [Ruminiclostridium sp.]
MEIKISPLDEAAAIRANERWDSVAKPLGSLGLFEDTIIKIAGIQGTENVRLKKRSVIVMCADNGVVREGVSQSDSSVTALCTNEISAGRSNVNVIAETVNAEVIAVDIGVAGKTNARNFKVAEGTKNIAEGASMTREEAERAVNVGTDLMREQKEKGADIVVTGEMGIGNTTTSAAIASVLLGLSPREVTGRGAGLDDAGLERKIEVIERAISINKPDPNDALDVLAKVGGLDIAGMTGLFLGGAEYGIPVVIDGAISAVAALLACRIEPRCKDYILASHVSAEPVGKMLLDAIGVTPLITAGMRLGEGTGALMLLPMLDCALSVYYNAHTFDEINLERYKPL